MEYDVAVLYDKALHRKEGKFPSEVDALSDFLKNKDVEFRYEPILSCHDHNALDFYEVSGLPAVVISSAGHVVYSSGVSLLLEDTGPLTNFLSKQSF